MCCTTVSYKITRELGSASGVAPLWRGDIFREMEKDPIDGIDVCRIVTFHSKLGVAWVS